MKRSFLLAIGLSCLPIVMPAAVLAAGADPTPTNNGSTLTPSAAWPAVNPKTSLDWPQVGNDSGRTRFSSLKQINKNNVANLKPAWTFHGNDSGNSIQCTPVVVNGVMYVTTASIQIVALDAATGKVIWAYNPKAGGVNRGVAYWTDGKAERIIAGLEDGRVLSLDAKTGQLDPNFAKGGTLYLRDGYEQDLSRTNYGCSSAPAIFENLVVIPIHNSEGHPGSPGDIRAFDVRTGREKWRFYTVPRPFEYGSETWPDDSWKGRSGTNAWSGYTVDEKNGIIFAATGSAGADFYGADRQGDNLFANCLLALDARTGQRLWHFQTVHHDLWDNDNPCPPTLCTAKGQAAVALATKTGFVYVFERKTGKPLYNIVEKPAGISDIAGEKAAATQPMPVAPPPLVPQVVTDADLTTRTPEAAAEIRQRMAANKWRIGEWRMAPSLSGTIAIPGFHGGANWSGSAYDPGSGLLFVNMNNVPSLVKLNDNGKGGFNFDGYNWFRDKDGYPAVKPPWGTLSAVDLNKGTIAWQVPLGTYPELTDKTTGSENFGGAIATAGGLVFIASTRDEKLHAFDSASGKILWEGVLPAGGYACPATYQVNGKQYVVIAAGGGGKIGTRKGDSFEAFALP